MPQGQIVHRNHVGNLMECAQFIEFRATQRRTLWLNRLVRQRTSFLSLCPALSRLLDCDAFYLCFYLCTTVQLAVDGKPLQLSILDTAGLVSMDREPDSAAEVLLDSISKHLCFSIQRIKDKRYLDCLHLRLLTPPSHGQVVPRSVPGIYATFYRTAMQGRRRHPIEPNSLYSKACI